MKRLLPLVVSVLCVSSALAEPPAAAPAGAAAELVNALLLVPLQRAEAKRSRFSRAAPVALERRVRVLDGAVVADVHGKSFVRFAIDERRFGREEGAWRRESVSGCAYLNEREVFVRRGDKYLPARSLLGKDAKERPGACRAAGGEAIGSAVQGPDTAPAAAAKG
jgi:hypothetical protein